MIDIITNKNNIKITKRVILILFKVKIIKIISLFKNY